MITVLLGGGLGNQLFQYALGRTLSLKHQAKLVLDLTSIGSKLQNQNLATYRRYELEVFDLPVETKDLTFKGKYLYPLSKAEFLLKKFIHTKRFHYIKETQNNFDPRILQAPDDSYIDGYFQSEKYFLPQREVLLNELQFKKPLSGKNAEWQKEIQSGNSVSLHFRRGDYVRLPWNVQKHGTTDMEYYHRAMHHIAASVSDPRFYVFTDEPAWVRENLQTGFPVTLVDTNQTPDTAYIDMQLMSLCRHNIICNSTFSWWGAWLNRNPEKQVIAPQQWFVDPTINAQDILPGSWIKL